MLGFESGNGLAVTLFLLRRQYPTRVVVPASGMRLCTGFPRLYV
jgi:hypothetical protein